jgi:hypothetical protein
MSPRMEILESASRVPGAPGDGALDQRPGLGVVPLLGGERRGSKSDEERNQQRRASGHRRAISRRALAAASALAAAVACEDVQLPGGGTVTTADLVVLPLQSGAPGVASATFWVYNDRLVTRDLNHQDTQLNPYLQIEFPPGCLSSLNGSPLSVDDSVQVTIEARPGAYGLTLSPSGLEFTLETPTVTFFYGRYADLSVIAGEPAFPDEAAYLAALEVWEEVTVGQWRVARGSGSAGVDAIVAAVDAPGELLVAARR